MALVDLFKLAKLTIWSYEDLKREKPREVLGQKSLEVMYNPETLTTRHGSVAGGEEPASGASTKPLRRRAQELSVKLVFDGTEVSHYGIEQLWGIRTVSEWVELFLAFCYNLDSASHQPLFLKLMWGNGIWSKWGFDCQLSSVDINYTLFDRDGSPLRADLDATFVEAMDPEKASKVMRLSSPDLTHRRVVRDGDTLPLLCREIYGSAEHYLRVARVNGLDHFRDLVPGQELVFPPFARKGRG